MNNADIFFERPWLLLLILPVLAIILIPFFRQPEKKRKTVKKLLPVILHIIISALLVLLISGFAIVNATDEQALMLVLDFSHSTESVQDEITEHADEIMSLTDKNIPVGVIAFGADAVYSVELGDGSRNVKAVEVKDDATDIASALEYAASLFTSDRSGRIILMSDGKQNAGDAASAAHNLGNQDIRIDTVYFDTTSIDTPEIQLSSFNAQEAAYAGDELVFTAEVKSNTAMAAVLNLYDNDALVSTKTADLSEGSSIIQLTALPETEGLHTYHLIIDAESDTTEENNEMFACVNVYDSPSVLIITGDNTDGSALEEILSADMQVDMVDAASAPDSIMGLCDYDEIILMNVNKIELPSRFDEILETYVSEYGRGLLMVGGRNTMIYGGMRESTYEEMLPLSFEYNKSDDSEPVALMLVLDCSMSMTNNSNNLSLAKQGAIKSIDAMTDNDYVGIVSFNSTAYLKSPLIRATDANKESLVRIVSELTTSQGTYYTDAFETALEALKDADQNVKHILFLSDGNPSDSDYSEAIKEIVADGITISTIGLGYSSDILSAIADYAGGRYYYIASADDLPAIMLSETEQVTANSLITEKTIPIIAVQSKLTADLADQTLPALQGYIGLTTKDDATAYITTEDGDPVYAAWKYGEGTVAAFTSDLTSEWSEEWLTSENGMSVIRNMAATTVNAVHSSTSLKTDIEVTGTSADITVTTSGTNTGHVLTAYASDGTTEQSVVLEQTNLGIYKGSIDVDYLTTYSIHIEECDQKENVLDDADIMLPVSYPDEYDAFAAEGLELLSVISSYTDGITSDNMQELSEVEVSVIDLNYIPLVPFGIAVLILLLADIAVRKLRWKDIRNYLLIARHKLGK